MLFYGHWQRKFGSDPHIIGRTITIDGKPREIIGMLPQAFEFADRMPSVILPFQLDRSKVGLGNFSFQAMARLKAGATIERASADIARMIPIVMRGSRHPTEPA